MASANDGDRTASGLLPFLLGMAIVPSPALRQGMVVMHHIILGGGDLFSDGDGCCGAPPASKSVIAALKEVKAGEEGESLSECAICLDGVEAGKEMPCGHRLHGECLERWLGLHGTCPVCRHVLPAEAEEEGAAQPPRSAVVVSYVVVGDGGEERRREEEREREAAWTVRIEDVD